MSDLIDRQLAISELMPTYKSASLRNRNVFSTARKCMATIVNLPSAEKTQDCGAEAQRAYEQGVKDTLDKYDETCRIASEIRVSMGCKTAKECWELIRNGEMQRVKHGRWIDKPGPYYRMQAWCSCCGQHSGIGGIESNRHKPYCPNCGAKMDLED